MKQSELSKRPTARPPSPTFLFSLVFLVICPFPLLWIDTSPDESLLMNHVDPLTLYQTSRKLHTHNCTKITFKHFIN